MQRSGQRQALYPLCLFRPTAGGKRTGGVPKPDVPEDSLRCNGKDDNWSGSCSQADVEVRLMLRRFPYFEFLTVTGLMIGLIAIAPAQPGPQGKGKKGDEIDRFGDRLERLRRQYSDLRPADPERRSCA